MDKLTKIKRSWNMSRIKSKNTKPEIVIRKSLSSNGFRYRIHSNLPGKPDLSFKSKKPAVFINGCFWHFHGCKNSNIPKTNSQFWRNKLNNNIKRDIKNYEELNKEKWKVIIVWECEIEKNLEKVIKKIIKQLN